MCENGERYVVCMTQWVKILFFIVMYFRNNTIVGKSKKHLVSSITKQWCLQIRICLHVKFQPIVNVVMRTWVSFYAVFSSKKIFPNCPHVWRYLLEKSPPGAVPSAFLGYRCVSFNIIICGRIKTIKWTIFHAKITESKEKKSVNASSLIPLIGITRQNLA